MSRKTPKTTVIAMRVSIEQREAIEMAAVTAGASVSGFVAATMAEVLSRKQTPARAVAPPPVQTLATHVAGISISDPSALAELKRIGININQLAHAANAGYPPNVASMLESLQRLFSMLSEPAVFKRHLDRLDTTHAPRPPSAEPRTRIEPIPPAASSTPPATRRPSLPPGLAASIAEAAASRPDPKFPNRAVAPKPEAPAPRLPPRPQPQPAVKDDRRAPQHPQARNQLQSRPELRPARPAEGDDGKGRLGFFRKLWDG
jgi:hypothetical protein